jgi:DNA-binding beta-propeller fold protein YncE
VIPMARINLDSNNVRVVNLSVEQVRKLVGATEDYIGDYSLDTALDEAQGEVFVGNSEIQYVVIMIAR